MNTNSIGMAKRGGPIKARRGQYVLAWNRMYSGSPEPSDRGEAIAGPYDDEDTAQNAVYRQRQHWRTLTVVQIGSEKAPRGVEIEESEAQ